MSARFLGRTKALLAATALAATLATGCTAGQWEPQAPPAAGVQQEEDGVKARNVLIVSDEQGNAVLQGTVTADRAFVLTAAGFSAEQPDGTWSEAVELPIAGEAEKGKPLTFGGSEFAFQSPDLHPGLLARVGLSFDEGVKLMLDVPVYDASHPDFATAWAEATQG
ncbi:MAG TPA: hypothetical protein PKE40_05340 [Arachnia sp.]|nr:hypothetical protein [Arachnia sp.]HMT85759.1 hypothetical protein [Arachnia sp.]